MVSFKFVYIRVTSNPIKIYTISIGPQSLLRLFHKQQPFPSLRQRPSILVTMGYFFLLLHSVEVASLMHSHAPDFLWLAFFWFIHAVTHINNMFSTIHGKSFIERIYHKLLVHFPVGGHFDSFQMGLTASLHINFYV